MGVKRAPSLVGAVACGYDGGVLRVFAVTLVVASIAACGDATRVRIIDVVEPDGTLGLKDVTLLTIEDLEAVSGSPATIFGDAAVALPSGGRPADGGSSRAALVSHPRRVHATWVMDGDVAVASDYDSLLMFTAYAHFEAAALFYTGVGFIATDAEVPVYYEPEVVGGDTIGLPDTDNAAFFADADAFILLPMSILQDVPLGMNPGVIAHEYAHRVWYYSFWSGELFAALEEFQNDGIAGLAWNRIRATDEGVADFYGAAITGDPDFLSQSAPPAIAEPRRLTEVRVLDPAWLGGLEPVDDEDSYRVYVPGSVVASSLWRVAEAVGTRTVAVAVLAAQRSLAPAVRRTFRYEYGQLEAEVIANLPAADRAAACARFQESYAAAWGQFTAVCP